MALVRYGCGKITAKVEQKTENGKKVTSNKDITPKKATPKGK
jgi:hypothetical protein